MLKASVISVCLFPLVYSVLINYFKVPLDNVKWAEWCFAYDCAGIPQSSLVFRVQMLPFICIQISPDHYQLKQDKKDLVPETPVSRRVSPVHSGF